MLICLNFIGHVNAQLEKKPHQPLQIYFFSFPIFFLYFFFQFSYNFFKINFIFPHSSLFFFPNPEHSSLFFPQTQDSPPSLPISYSSLNHWCLCHLFFTATTRTALTATIKSFMGCLQTTHSKQNQKEKSHRQLPQLCQIRISCLRY